MRSINKNTFTRLILRHKLTPLKKKNNKKNGCTLLTLAQPIGTDNRLKPFPSSRNCCKL